MAKQKSLFKTKVVPGKPGTGNMFDEEFTDDDEPVICLGMEFENDETRREHFTELLRQNLKDPEFRKIEGFPIGEDEDILALSDPPYYTACPNPWIKDFITEWEFLKPAQEDGYEYHREPFAADVSEGKNDPIYNAHSYHTKVPHKAVMRYTLHYTEPGDIVFDGFCGTGMTGQEFQLGLSQRFSERDGMYFLSEQVAEYDRKKMIGGGKPLQRSLFVCDEASAIDWLQNLIRDKPQIFQEINPLFMKEIGGQSKNEKSLELSILLEQNFLRYYGKDNVPEQIHAYLSSNWKDMRKLEKNDPVLITKLFFHSYRKVQEGNPELGMMVGKSNRTGRVASFRRYEMPLSEFKLQILRSLMNQADLLFPCCL